MEETQSFRFFNRGPSPAARLAFFGLLSLLLLFVDARYQYLETARSALSVIVYPFQRLAAVPGELWRSADDYLTLQGRLVRSNEDLARRHNQDSVQLQQFQALQAENQHLREMLAVQQRPDYPAQMAEIAYIERDIFRRKLFLDKGSQASVQPGQVVIDDVGVVGQVTRVYPWLSEVTLITDKGHAVPVQVLRNGLRTVVFGSGDTGDLSLSYMPNSADLQEGDVLVTSGIDGTYPPGLPVARVEHIVRDLAYPFARIRCAPLAGVNRHRQLLILSAPSNLPAPPAPPPDEAAEKPAKGKHKRP